MLISTLISGMYIKEALVLCNQKSDIFPQLQAYKYLNNEIEFALTLMELCPKGIKFVIFSENNILFLAEFLCNT